MTKEVQEFSRLFTQTSVISFPVKSVDGYDYGYIYPIKERKDVLDKFKILKIKIVRSNRWGSTMVGIPHMTKFLDLLQGSYRRIT